MKNFVHLLIYSLISVIVFAQPNTVSVDFEKYFEDKTMRVDYLHGGNSQSESFKIFAIKHDGVWGGRVKVMNDPYNLGLYAFDVVDVASGKVLYTQGFCSVFGEWQTTLEATRTSKDFEESIRFPWPKNVVKIVMRKRDSTNTFQTLWTETINPTLYANAYQTGPLAKVRYFLSNGNPKEKIDIVVLADGYTAADSSDFSNDVQRFIAAFFSVEPFKSRESDFNVAAVYSTSPVSGIRLQESNYYPANVLGCTYFTFETERYVLTEREWTVRDYASLAPYDFLVILLNSTKYGGGGIYNLYITASAKTSTAAYVMVHEMGHHIAGLADEYYTSDVAYQVTAPKYEPWEFNITALLNPQSLKWKNLVEPNTPIPTPWQKEQYERTGKLDINDEPYYGKVGAFEGAAYLSKDMYRPEVDCIMFSHSLKFCRVCHQGLSRVMDMYVAK